MLKILNTFKIQWDRWEGQLTKYLPVVRVSDPTLGGHDYNFSNLRDRSLGRGGVDWVASHLHLLGHLNVNLRKGAKLSLRQFCL